MRSWVSDTLLASLAYLVASFLSFEVLMPLQGLVFGELRNHGSLLFLPHGVRVLAAWLLGWRAIFALLPGVLVVFAFVGGMDIFLPSRLFAIVATLITCPLIFYILKWLGWNLFPCEKRNPCWLCVMGAGIAASIFLSALTNVALDGDATTYVAYLIGDVAGLFFLMVIMYFTFVLSEKI